MHKCLVKFMCNIHYTLYIYILAVSLKLWLYDIEEYLTFILSIPSIDDIIYSKYRLHINQPLISFKYHIQNRKYSFKILVY